MIKKEFLLLGMIMVAILTRFLFIVDGESIFPNFTAIGAIAILGACHFKGYKKWLFPLAALWISDIILNNVIYAQYYDSFQVFGNFWVYGSMFIIGILGYYIMKKRTWTNLFIASIVGGIVFFLITNFAVWLDPLSPYSKDISGLFASYSAGVLFFRNAILGNLFYGFALFGIYEYIAARSVSLKPVISY